MDNIFRPGQRVRSTLPSKKIATGVVLSVSTYSGSVAVEVYHDGHAHGYGLDCDRTRYHSSLYLEPTDIKLKVPWSYEMKTKIKQLEQQCQK